mgnify:CR=1 FL=1|tara:strand:+ start:3101 stop:4267 length:1167 start_codon:yes stop_codon:yes gene_type:complete
MKFSGDFGKLVPGWKKQTRMSRKQKIGIHNEMQRRKYIQRHNEKISRNNALKEPPHVGHENSFISNTKYFIINNNTAGGSYKWETDIEKYIPCTRIFNHATFSRILSHHNNPNNIVVLINSFLLTDFTIENLLQLYDIYKFKVVIPIHDWYWFNVGWDYNLKHHHIYLDKNMKLPESSKKLFDICNKIICPSNFVYEIILKHYPSNKVEHIEWIDYNLSNLSNNYKINKNGRINIGVFVGLSECKGVEQIRYLVNRFKSTIKFCIVGKNIEKYEDNYGSFIDLIKKYNIHGLLYLNKWGETWCYGLSKGLTCGLPILYNNIGAFKERIPNTDKYIINNNNESQFYDRNMLNNNFEKLLTYIRNNEIYVNDTKPKMVENSILIDYLKSL